MRASAGGGAVPSRCRLAGELRLSLRLLLLLLLCLGELGSLELHLGEAEHELLLLLAEGLVLRGECVLLRHELLLLLVVARGSESGEIRLGARLAQACPASTTKASNGARRAREVSTGLRLLVQLELGVHECLDLELLLLLLQEQVLLG